jgi:hypothetical protein
MTVIVAGGRSWEREVEAGGVEAISKSEESRVGK